MPLDCISRDMGSLGKDSCVKILDLSLYVQSGRLDMPNSSKIDRAEIAGYCSEDRTIVESQIADLVDKVQMASSVLAIATEDQFDAGRQLKWKSSQAPEVTRPLDCISTDMGTLATGSRVKSRDLSLYVQSSRGSACRRGHVEELLDDELKCRGCNGWVINPEGGLGHRTVRGRPLGAPGFSAR